MVKFVQRIPFSTPSPPGSRLKQEDNGCKDCCTCQVRSQTLEPFNEVQERWVKHPLASMEIMHWFWWYGDSIY